MRPHILRLWFALALAVLPATASVPTPEEIKKVAVDLVCLCGSCNRQSLATCICTEFAVPQRQHIGQLLQSGKSAEEIVTQYIAEFGVHILAAPPARGYSLVAWIGPFVGLIIGFAAVRLVLKRWRWQTPGAAEPAGVAATPKPAGTADYRRQLEQELGEFDEER